MIFLKYYVKVEYIKASKKVKCNKKINDESYSIKYFIKLSITYQSSLCFH
jgi:hypothetical protein